MKDIRQFVEKKIVMAVINDDLMFVYRCPVIR